MIDAESFDDTSGSHKIDSCLCISYDNLRRFGLAVSTLGKHVILQCFEALLRMLVAAIIICSPPFRHHPNHVTLIFVTKSSSRRGGDFLHFSLFFALTNHVSKTRSLPVQPQAQQSPA